MISKLVHPADTLVRFSFKNVTCLIPNVEFRNINSNSIKTLLSLRNVFIEIFLPAESFIFHKADSKMRTQSGVF